MLIFGCKKNLQNNISERENTTIEVGKMNSHKFGEMEKIKSAKYVFLNNKQPIGNIEKLLFHKDLIIVHDRIGKKILIYNQKGSLISVIDRHGKSGEEYTKISDVSINHLNKEVVVFDGYSHNIMKYDIHSGESTGRCKISFYPLRLCFLNKAIYYYNPFTFNYINDENKFALVRTNLKNDIDARYISVDDKFGNFNAITSTGFFHGNENFFIPRYSRKIYLITDSTVCLKYKIKFEDDSVAYKRILDKAIRQRKSGVFSDHSVLHGINNLCNTNDYISFSYCKNTTKCWMLLNKQDNTIVYNTNAINLLPEELMKKEVWLFIWPEYSTKNKFVSVLPSQRINTVFNRNRKLYSKYQNNNVVQKLLNHKIEDNPVIAFYEIK